MGMLEGKAIVVTGAGRGIGAAYARAAAQAGASVVVNDIDAEPAEDVAADISAAGGRATVKVADVSDRSQAQGLIEHCVGELGAIDGLVNNAGLFDMSLPGDVPESMLRDILEVNVLGVAACTVAAIRHMRRRGAGSIVNITSGAHFGIPMMAAYAASKGAVASLTYTWSLELEGTGIRVNAISPLANTRMAVTGNEFLEANGLEKVQLSTSPPPEANAPLAVYLLSDAAAHVTGQIVRIEGSHLSLVAHPVVLQPILQTEGWWTPEGVAQAFDETLDERLVPTGMQPQLRAEYLTGGSEFWAGGAGSESSA
jgi:NAD(P)-dependent dehydrogenase (short-subunit alcohol dehydrogenase family)